MSIRAFDLNIEEVLENWEVEHALREIIANALDEQFISQAEGSAERRGKIQKADAVPVPEREPEARRLSSEEWTDLLTIATFHVEAGGHDFANFSSRMIGYLDDGIQPYLADLHKEASARVDALLDGELERPTGTSNAGVGVGQATDIEISKDSGSNWHIRDFGRGLRIEHFTLNENQEKLNAAFGVIGKFGVGLKDSLATFHRRGIEVHIRSSYGTYRLKHEHKYGFNDIVTLHVEYEDTANEMVGTDFILRGVEDVCMARAKSMFLKFAGEETLENNTYGQVLRRSGSVGRVYILGVFASEEPNFLFSYNITSLTDSMKKKLNRERLNVGRTTYADRVKAILKNSTSTSVQELLIDQVGKRATGEQCDEMAWIEISQMALNLLHTQMPVAYFTEHELQSSPNILDTARSDGFRIVVISEQQKTKLNDQVLTGGPQVRTIETYVQQYNASFEYQFIDYRTLTREEKRIYDFTLEILALVGITGTRVPEIRISETMRVTTDNTEGVWDPSLRAIVIKRNKLRSLVDYAATLLHEAGHATTGTVDATREFEGVLTAYLGRTATIAISR